MFFDGVAIGAFMVEEGVRGVFRSSSRRSRGSGSSVSCAEKS